MWVAAQVFAHADPSFDVFEFAEWCEVRVGAENRVNGP
jgi:hypothetical protein